MKLSKKLENKFSNNISNNARLANYSWFNLGGPADYLFKPKNKNQLIEFLKENKNEGKLNITIIGAGSNTLIRDKGIKVSCIAPALIKTKMAEPVLKNHDINTLIAPKEISDLINQLIYNPPLSMWQEEIILKRTSYK